MGSHKGFTLIELMITVAIIAILAAIAIPSYNQYVLRSNRTAAQGELMQLSGALERFYASNYTYVGAAGGTNTSGTPDAAVFGYSVVPSDATGTSVRYNLTLTGLTANGYTAVATAANAQTSDTNCAILSLSSTGARTSTDSGNTATLDCW